MSDHHARRSRWIAAALITTSVIAVTATRSSPVHAATIDVTTTADTSTTACSLRDAITAANTDTDTGGCPAGSGADIINLTATGTYNVGSNPLPPITGALTLNGNNRTITAAHLFRALQVEPGATATINDLTLTNGNGFYNRGTATLDNVSIVDNITSGNGAGIFNPGTLTVTNSDISRNTADTTPGDGTPDRVGGGIYNTGIAIITNTTIDDNTANNGGGINNTGTITITDSTVNNNTGNNGGGINNTGTATITDSTIDNNTASDGGGISNTGIGTAIITGSTVNDNTADGAGGGIDNVGTATITGSTVNNNTASDSGGGIISEGDATIADSTIDNNNTAVSGGGIAVFSGETTIVGTTIDGNTAALRGGGLFEVSGTDTTGVLDTTISGNTATRGAGAYIQDSLVGFSNSTLSGNSADESGGGLEFANGHAYLTFVTVSQNDAASGAGIFSDFDFPTPAISRMTASIVGGNVGGGDDVELSNGFTDPFDSRGFNVVGSVGDGVTSFDGPTDVTNADPVLGPLADNGGPTLTHALLAGSPAIDRVTGTFSNQPVVDQRGVARPEGAHPDSGAFEDDDADDDDVLDETDNCPTAANADQADNDGDGDGDVCDPDDDNDGDLDAIDNCPTVANSDQADVDNDGVGDLCDPHNDIDDDGIADHADNCPTVANPDQADLDNDGVGDRCDPTDDRDVFSSSTPKRFADSRDEDTFDGLFRNTGPRAGDSAWEIQIAGRGGVPANATAAIINLTVLNGAAPGFATAYPCTTTVPKASSVNYLPDAIEPNEIITKLSATGTVCIYTLTTADVIVDVVGNITNSPYQALNPARYADSRNEPTFDDQQRNTGIRTARTTWEIPIAGRGNVPANAAAVVINLTVTGGTTPGFATVHPCGTLPVASSLNYGPGITRPNELITKLSATGTVCVYTLTDVDVILDVVGYINDVPGYTALTPARYADSRNEPTFDRLHRNTGIRGPRTTWEIPIAGRGNVPADATTAVINLTITGSTTPGFATVHPCGTLPRTSSINYTDGTTRPNELITKLSPTGTICIYTLTNVHIIIDVVGHT